MKTETVRINLPQVRNELPPKRPSRKEPTGGNFKVVPRYAPYLSSSILTLDWNCVERTITLSVQETANFEAFNWFGTINKRLAESQKSSFVDLDLDSILIFFQNEDGQDVAMLKLKALQLTSHSCIAGPVAGISAFGIDSTSNPLFHRITIKYGDCESVPVEHEEDRVGPDKVDMVDLEWQQ